MPRSWRTSLAVLLGYAAVSFAYFGWRLLPHPGRVVLGVGFDPQIFVWSFAWWEHALATGANPFVTHAIYAPSGINLTWTGSAPGVALAFAPLTALVGPVASFNVAMVLLPALAAWTAYLLCRRLTGSTWASVVGGYLFGFSAYMLGEELGGHPNLIGVFLLPLVALAVVRYVEGEIGGRGLAWRLGVLLAVQVWISTEIAFTATLALVLGLVLAYALVPDARPRLRSALPPIAAAYVLALLLAAPFLAYAVLGFVPGTIWNSGPEVATGNAAGTDLANFVVPTRLIGSGALASVSPDLSGEGSDGYLGLPTLLVVVLLAVRGRRSAGVRFLVAALAAAAVVALGTALWVDGHRLVGLPWWDAAQRLPAFDNVFAFRLAAYVSLAAAVAVAVWTATARGRIYSRPYVLPILTVAALVPAVWTASGRLSLAPRRPPRPVFFADGLYRSCVGRNETLAVFPFGGGGDSVLWQAESGFRFRLAADGLQPVTRYGARHTSFEADPVVFDINFANAGRPTLARLLAFAAEHGVARFVSVVGSGYPDLGQMRQIGPVERVGGVLVSPACGARPLTDRDLSRYVAASRRLEQSRANVGYCQGLTFSLVPAGLDPAGPLAGARRAIFVAGRGLTCAAPPAGYERRGFATAAMNVTPHTYAFYAPRPAG